MSLPKCDEVHICATEVKKRKYQGEWMICRINWELGKEQRKHLLGARGNGREKRANSATGLVKQRAEYVVSYTSKRMKYPSARNMPIARSRESGCHNSRSKRVATREVVQRVLRRPRGAR
jgi:energy-coupling factor transporter ATP-binding protein EcfA2